MRANPILKWLVDARNRIEKQGDLKTRSTLRATTYFGWLQSHVYESDLPVPFRTADIAKRLGAKSSTLGFPDGTVVRVERRWVEAELPNSEILEALTYAYEHLQLLLYEAHGLLPNPFLGGCSFQENIRLTNFFLPDEMLHPFNRRQWVDAKVGSVIDLGFGTQSAMVKEAAQKAKERYGDVFAATVPMADVFRSECEYFFSAAKQMLVRDGHHISTAIFRKGFQTQLVQYNPPSRAGKHAYVREIADLARRLEANYVILIGEVWTASIPIPRAGVELVHASDVPNRGEALSLHGINCSGEEIDIKCAFTREKDIIIFGTDEVADGSRVNMMDPFRAIWRKDAPKS